MKVIRTFIASLLVTLYACQTTNMTTDKVNVDLDYKGNEAMARLFEISEIAPIDSSEYLLSDVSHVKTVNNRLYILDYIQKRILLLNPLNNALSIVVDKKGMAQYEYVGIDGFAVAHNGDIYVLDGNSKKVVVYNADGKFKRVIRDVDGSSVAVNGKGQIGLHCLSNGGDVNVEILSSEGKAERTIENNADYMGHSMVNGNEIVAVGNDFYYCNPFDFKVYKVSDKSEGPIIEFDFGKYQSDIDKIRKVKTKDFPKYLLKDNSITNIEQISAYKDYLFFSTSRMDQIVYDMKKRKAVCLSHLPHPYDFLFLSPLTVDEEGNYYIFVRGSNIKNALLPYLEYKKEGLEGCRSALKYKDSKAQYWLLKGKIKL